MIPKKNNMQSFLKNDEHAPNFVIPVYQRNYDWKEKNCEELFYELLKGIRTGKLQDFGDIIYDPVYDHHNWMIVDGQQRIITCTLMLKALRDVTTDEKLKKVIDSEYLYKESNGRRENRPRLGKSDNAVYCVMLDNDPDTYEKKLSDRQKKESNVYKNYCKFVKLIKKYCDSNECCWQILDSLKYLCIIDIELEKDDDAQKSFDARNGKGVHLTPVDLLKNYFFMPFHDKEKQDELYNKYWVTIEDNVGPDMESFFVDYMICKKLGTSTYAPGKKGGSHITGTTIEYVFRDYCETEVRGGKDKGEFIEELLEDMTQYSQEYKNTVFRDELDPFADLDELHGNVYEIVKFKPALRCLVLYLFMECRNGHHISDKVLNDCVSLLSRVAFRSMVCSSDEYDSKKLNDEYAGAVMRETDKAANVCGFKTAFSNALDTAGKGHVPTDAEVKKALYEKAVYTSWRKDNTKYVMYKIEKHSHPKGLPAYGDKFTSIDHIAAQSIPKGWAKDLGLSTASEKKNFKNNYMNLLGNLTLTSENSEMKNKTFDKKKAHYQTSGFPHTRSLCDYDKWTISAIRERTAKMADEVIAIWPWSEECCTPHKGEYGLTKEGLKDFEDFFSAAKNSGYSVKPEMVVIDKQKIPVTDWKRTIVAVYDFLKGKDKNASRKSILPEKDGKFKYKKDLPANADLKKYKEIEPGICVYTATCATDTLKAVSRIVANFDHESGTSYAGSFKITVCQK